MRTTLIIVRGFGDVLAQSANPRNLRQKASSNAVNFGLSSSKQLNAFALAAVHTAFGLVLQPYALVYFDPPGIANALMPANTTHYCQLLPGLDRGI